jgi:hypothetical protein
VLRYREALWSATYKHKPVYPHFRAQHSAKSSRSGRHPPPFSSTAHLRARGGGGYNAGRPSTPRPGAGGGNQAGQPSGLCQRRPPAAHCSEMAIGRFQFELSTRSGTARRAHGHFSIHYLVHKGLLDYPVPEPLHRLPTRGGVLEWPDVSLQRDDWQTWHACSKCESRQTTTTDKSTASTAFTTPSGKWSRSQKNLPPRPVWLQKNLPPVLRVKHREGPDLCRTRPGP